MPEGLKVPKPGAEEKKNFYCSRIFAGFVSAGSIEWL